MNISSPFIRRPVATSLLALGLLMAGILAYTRLPVAPIPQVEYPVISVGAGLPGASPETMASSVATPLERQFGRIAGVNQMTSTSQLGSTNITLQFDLNRNIDAAARDVQAAINAALGQLPANLPTRPNWRKVNPADAPIMILALTSDTMTLPRMYDVADSVLAQKLSQVRGIGQVFVGGGARPAVRAEVNPTLLSKLGVGVEQVRNALASANANRAKGEIAGPVNAWQITDNDQLFTADQYRNVIVAGSKNGTVRLGDVADVQDSVEDIRNAGLANGAPAVLMIVFRQPGANIIEAVDSVKELLPQLQASIPAGMHLEVALDRTLTIRASVSDIQRTLVISIILVVLVVFVFLRNLRATLIPSVAVPLSLIGTFGVMYLLDYSVDNLSLMALAISTGFVVDDAIVVIEDITRHLEAGVDPVTAAFRGAREIGFTVLSMSSSLVAVFIPILFMAGLVGRFFREFAVVLSTAIGISLIVSLTLTPMLCAKFLRRPHEEKHGRLYRLSESGFDLLHRIYRSSLGWVLKHQPLTLAITIATAVLSVYLYIEVPKGFFPQQDTGRFGGAVQAEQDISFPALRDKMKQFVDIVRKDPAIDTVMAFSGGQGTSNTGRMFGTLKPLNERDRVRDRFGSHPVSVEQVINRLRGKLAAVPGATLFLTATQDLNIGGRFSNAQFQYTLQAEDLTELNYWAPRILQKLRTMPELRDVNTDQQNKGLSAQVQVDRDTASRLGISPAQVDQALYTSFGQAQVSTMYRQLNQYHVVMEVDPKLMSGPEALQNTYVKSSTGAEVPLAAFAKYVPSNTSLQVNHQGVFPAVTISFNLALGVPLGNATIVVERAMRDLGVPTTVHGGFQGTAAAFKESLSNQPVLILTALITVYIVLGMLYESTVHPITILSTLPSAGVGAILAIWLTGNDLNVIAMIGILLLIGIVKKNAIMMIDFALQTEREGDKKPEDAIYEAATLRFRPIMMTTMAALLGGLPLALGSGFGSELRRPLGIAIVGGLIVSQALTLFTTPVVYLYLDRFRLRIINWRRSRRRRLAETLPEPSGD
ncbi:MAG TPA: multidrug efflux RND transporter permease subunit [Candidatus Angelobacter sp.]|jgi:multidrug efflux pump|nr:multidrug efflux RND transporter permease subunit [Candidatus Angelobacter sp.]